MNSVVTESYISSGVNDVYYLRGHFGLSCLLVLFQGPPAEALDAQSLVEDSFNYMRDKSSVSEVVMTVHRPDWERKMTIKAWTRGRKDSLFYIEAPPKDHGNGTLKKGTGDVDVQSQDQPGDQSSPVDDVPVLDGIGFFQ